MGNALQAALTSASLHRLLVRVKAAVLTELNRPYQIKEVPDPTPGPGEVRIRVHACGLCGTDIHVLRGEMGFKVPLPLIGGHEPVGVVDEVGAGVTRLSKGDRVGVSWWQGGCGRCAFCQRGRGVYCPASKNWLRLGGGNGELMIADERGVTLLPERLGFEEAAPIFCAGYSVVSGYRAADPRPGDRVGILGLGGLGHLAVQYANAFGHEVIAITNSEDKRAFAKQLGAHEIVLAGGHAGKAIAKAGGVDILISTSNSVEQTSQALHGLRPEGRLISLLVSPEPLAIHQGLLMARFLSVKGAMQGDRKDLIDALDLVAAGKVKPMLELYPIEEINSVVTRLDENKVRFRAVLQHRT
jgi:D-arabinose 1-dehydrogenase-like Zn-dependent alcohol dehydrogenase